MILLITDGQPCTLRSFLCEVYQKVAFLELQNPQFSPAFNSALEDSGFEFAVIECFMNVHRCLELLREIKRRRPDVPVIFVIPSGSDHTVTETLSSGARYCFKKPLDVIRFNERIRMLLELKRVSRERRIPLLSADTKPEEDEGITNDMPEKILRTVHFIEDHASYRALSVERLARIACMSPFHFCRVFKKYTNKSPMQFVNHVRIEKAKEFLTSSSGSMSVSQIATTVGYCDSSNFNKHFKKATGLTPSAFKLKVRPIPSM
jgi:AraC-like DNA-binding protein